MSALDKVDMLFRLLEKALSICALSHTRMCFLSPSGLELLAIKPSNQILFDSITSSYGGPGGRATKHCTTSGFLIEQYSDSPIPCSNNGAAVRFCDRSHSAIKRSSTSATALTSIDLFLGSNNGLFLRSNSGPFLRPTSQTYYGIHRWYLA